MGSFNPLPSDSGPDVPVVQTPDQKALGKAHAQGSIEAGWAANFFAVFFAGVGTWLKAIITALADVMDEIAAVLTDFFTAAQGQDTPGFNNLVAAVLSDTLGVEVSGEELRTAQFEGGRIAAMDKVGADLFNTLANEFLGVGAVSEPGPGVGGLPGTPGVPLTPEQGVKAAQSFMGFALSFAVRQGNVAFLSSALPWEWLSGIREYGEMMAKNLGLGRLTRRALQPFIQTLISTPLQQALNLQYRPHVMDPKQLASAFIREDIDRSDFAHRLALAGFTDGDAAILINDTYTRLPLENLFLLHETGNLSDVDFTKGINALGFNSSDTGPLVLSRQLIAVQGADRKYAEIIAAQLVEGVITQAQYDDEVAHLRIPKLEADALTRNGAALKTLHHAKLSLGFLRKAYLNATITIQEYLDHAAALGYTQDLLDILEFEVLTEQKIANAKAAAKATKAAAKKKTPATTTPPATTPPGG
jgi:hypothetical protein